MRRDAGIRVEGRVECVVAVAVLAGTIGVHARQRELELAGLRDQPEIGDAFERADDAGDVQRTEVVVENLVESRERRACRGEARRDAGVENPTVRLPDDQLQVIAGTRAELVAAQVAGNEALAAQLANELRIRSATVSSKRIRFSRLPP